VATARRQDLSLDRRIAGWTCFAQATAAFASPTTGWLSQGCRPAVDFDVTHDGGSTWAPQALPDTGAGLPSLGSPAFTSGQDGVMLAPAAGGGALFLYVTDDSGESWIPHAAPGEWPHAVDFIDANNGWLLSTDTMDAGYPAGLYVTHDGGQSWTTLRAIDDGPPSEGTVELNGAELDFVTPTLGWTNTFSGTGDTLLQTTDGGLTWVPVSVQVSPADT
jgi:photosystem II stability/assembly factor-like uncharacterized protein